MFDAISIISALALLASLKFDNPRLDLIAVVSLSLFAIRTFFRYSNKYVSCIDICINPHLLSFAEHVYGLGRFSDIDCVIKIPLTFEGISLAPKIKEFGAKILMTACYEPKQMITACALKADYVAPYVGRMMDAGLDAMANMQIIQKIARKNKCIPVIASLRNAKQMLEIAEIGHDCFTISPEVARDLFDSKLTDAAVIAFEEAAKGDEK